jgi:hypothetical protein
MPNFTVKFHKMIQDSQEFGSNDEHMVSRVFFTLMVDGKSVGECSANVKQTVGSEIFNNAEIEVSSPNEYNGPFNHLGFSEVVQQYLNRLIGIQGRGIQIRGKVPRVRMQKNTFAYEAEYTF